jgi:hypothetical protein
MRNIKYIAFLFTIALMISCGEDDVESITNPGEVTPTSEISIGFSDSNDGLLVLENGGMVSYTIQLSVNPLSVDTEVSLGMTSSDGTIDGATFPASVTIPAGSTTADIDVTFADDGVAEGFVAETFTLQILDADFGGSTVFYLTPGDVNRNVSVADVLPVIVVTTAADVDFNFDWTGTSDLDCRIRNAALATIDTGYSVTPTETVTLPQTAPDGTYTVSIRPWTVDDVSIDYIFEFVSPAGSEIFTGNIMNATPGWSIEIPAIEITKVTDGATVTYTILEL